jgi:hypothetical protein
MSHDLPMSGETEQAVSGWTVDTLHAHIQRQLDDMRRMLDERAIAADRAVAAALDAAEKAVAKAESAAERRFESVNEFRAQLTDQTATFIPRKEYDVAHQSLIDRLGELQSRVDRAEGQDVGGVTQRTEQRLNSGQVIAGLSAFVLIIALAVSIIVATR